MPIGASNARHRGCTRARQPSLLTRFCILFVKYQNHYGCTCSLCSCTGFATDGDGHYWIAIPKGVTTLWKLSMRYPLLRKVTAMVAKWGFNLMFAEDAGVLQVDLDGNPIAFYHDHKISHLTTGVKIGKYLYCGSLLHSRILRLDLLKYPAQKSL